VPTLRFQSTTSIRAYVANQVLHLIQRFLRDRLHAAHWQLWASVLWLLSSPSMSRPLSYKETSKCVIVPSKR